MAEPNGTTQPAVDPEASAGELVKHLTEQVSRLIRDELKLAEYEMTTKAKRIGRGAGMFGGSGLVALYGVGCLLAAAIIGLAVVLPAWAAALIVGGALLVVAGVAALIGKSQLSKAAPPVPEQTVQSVKADVEEVKEKGTPMTAAEGTGEPGGAEAPPDNPEALVEEINRTREELGNTVEALAAKADVKARAQQKATDVSGQLKDKVRDVTQGLSGKAGQLKGEVTDRATGARQAAAENGKTVLSAGQPVTQTIASRAAQVGATAQSAATQAGATAWAATPEPVQQRARRVAATVNQHRVPFAAAAAAGALLLGGWLVVRGLRRR